METTSKNSLFSWKRGLFLAASILFVIVFYLNNPFSGSEAASQNVSDPKQDRQIEKSTLKEDTSGTETSIRLFKVIELKDVLGKLKNLSNF